MRKVSARLRVRTRPPTSRGSAGGTVSPFLRGAPRSQTGPSLRRSRNLRIKSTAFSAWCLKGASAMTTLSALVTSHIHSTYSEKSEFRRTARKWSPCAHWLGPQRSFVFRSHLLLDLRWAWGSCGFNTKHRRTKARIQLVPRCSSAVYRI